jgi:hypothetical protein
MLRPTAFDDFPWIKAGEMFADDLLRLVAFQTLCTCVPGEDMALRPQHKDGIVDGPLDEQAKLFSFLDRTLSSLVQFDEAPHLGFENDGHQGLGQEINRTVRISFFEQSAIDVVRGKKDDWRVPAVTIALNLPGCLDAAHARHQKVQQDDGEFLGLKLRNGFLPGRGFHELVAEIFEHRSYREQIGRTIVHEQNASFGLRLLTELLRYRL